MAIEEALQRLAAVTTFAEGLLPMLVENPRNVKKAEDVISVFRLYEARLRERSRGTSKSALSNSQREMVRRINKSAENSLNALEQGHSDAQYR